MRCVHNSSSFHPYISLSGRPLRTKIWPEDFKVSADCISLTTFEFAMLLGGETCCAAEIPIGHFADEAMRLVVIQEGLPRVQNRQPGTRASHQIPLVPSNRLGRGACFFICQGTIQHSFMATAGCETPSILAHCYLTVSSIKVPSLEHLPNRGICSRILRYLQGRQT